MNPIAQVVKEPRKVIVAIPMTALLIAGILKGIDVHGFLVSLSTWRLLPSNAALALSLFIPAMEIGIALAWFLNTARWTMELLALFLILGFTTIIAIHIAYGESPECGCLGWLSKEVDQLSDNRLLIARNLALIGCLLVGVCKSTR